jgi:hypothetical protein
MIGVGVGQLAVWSGVIQPGSQNRRVYPVQVMTAGARMLGCQGCFSPSGIAHAPLPRGAKTAEPQDLSPAVPSQPCCLSVARQRQRGLGRLFNFDRHLFRQHALVNRMCGKLSLSLTGRVWATTMHDGRRCPNTRLSPPARSARDARPCGRSCPGRPGNLLLFANRDGHLLHPGRLSASVAGPTRVSWRSSGWGR